MTVTLIHFLIFPLLIRGRWCSSRFSSPALTRIYRDPSRASACFFINRVYRTGPFSCNNQNSKKIEKLLTKGEGMIACVFEKYGRIITYLSLNKWREKLGRFLYKFRKNRSRR